MVECYIRIKEAMHLRNKTQAELCEITGIPKSAMSQYVSGKFAPKQTRIYLLAKALNVNEAWLMGYDVTMEREHSEEIPPSGAKKESAPELSEADREILDLFNKLKTDDKEMVLKIIRNSLK